MFVECDSDVPPPRDHPWTISETRPEARYWDFRAYPEKIPLVLEDFKPWSHYPAIQRFYVLLTRLNGDDSIFESNDCGLRPPRRDTEAPELFRRLFVADPIVMHGRLTIIFRDLNWNVSDPSVDGLKTAIHDGLRDNVPLFPAVVKIGDWNHHLTPINRDGRAVTVRSWAWGDDEEMAMSNLGGTFQAIHSCLQWISNAVKKRTAKPGG